MNSGNEMLALLLSYLLGCFATGYYLTRLRTGKDVRAHGSAGTGARNVGRILGRVGFAATFCGDVLKGFLAVWLATAWLQVAREPLAFCLLAVVVGHVWPVQLGFRGGRGIAVSLGGLLAYEWRIALGAALVFLVLYVGSRKYMMSGLAAVAALPVLAFWAQRPEDRPLVSVVAVAAVSVVILVAHRSHLRELTRRATERGS